MQKVGCSDTKVKMNAIDNDLSKIVGLDALKIQLALWFKGMLLDERRRALGLNLRPRKLPHLAFLGNPGTGKTMIARMLSKLLHMVGILPRDKVTEVQRTDLVGRHIGETGPKTREKIKEAEGGILFVDEAYRLVPAMVSYNDFGIEAIEEIMSFMDSGKVVVIFAGYTEPMERVISSNEGMRRRISNIFHFDDFTCQQLAKIMHLKLPNMDINSPFYGFKLDPRGTSVNDVAALIERGTTAEQRRKMNGGFVDQMLVKARENLDSRIDVECRDEYAMVAITSEDLAAGLRLLRAEEEKGESHCQQVEKDMKKDEDENLDSRIDVDSIVAITLEDLAVGLQLLRAEDKRGNYCQIVSRIIKYIWREGRFYFIFFYLFIALSVLAKHPPFQIDFSSGTSLSLIPAT